MDTKKEGDHKSFDKNWSTRKEALYNHWTAGEVENQIQLAFRMHWNLFKELMGKDFKGRRSLEVGCGRASISSYFAANGFDATCLDLSESVLTVAESIFKQNKIPAKFIQGNALDLPFPDKSFDVVVSIGLLEHFEDFEKVISEQLRVLDKGGLFLGYVVPENLTNIQKDYNWFNDILKLYSSRLESLNPSEKVPHKEEIYRSDNLSKPYLEVMRKMPIRDLQSSGVYPLPMVSPSISFPFTLMPAPMEAVLVKHFKSVLDQRKAATGQNPWLCDETYGQAFLLWGFKE